MRIVLAGNPNSGKTTLFNQLTGSSQKVGNYPGVTVEKTIGFSRWNASLEFIDLPGTYSLSSTKRSEDERVARDMILGADTDGVLVIVDATNLERQLFLLTQILDLGRPVAVVLTMMDLLVKDGRALNVAQLEEKLGVSVFALSGKSSDDVKQFAEKIQPASFQTKAQRLWKYEESTVNALNAIAQTVGVSVPVLVRVLTGQSDCVNDEMLNRIELEKKKFTDVLCDFRQQDVLARYKWIKASTQNVFHVTDPNRDGERLTKMLDRVFLSKIWAPIVFIAVMSMLFQSVFSWAQPAMDLIETGLNFLNESVSARISHPEWRSLVSDGIFAGVGNVVIFLPQICLLFFLLGLLEESGYLARAAFIVDRLFSKVGLSGKAFVPLLSGYACAVPAIMATRTIRDPKERLATILITPLMTCSARLPVYTVLVAAFVPTEMKSWVFFGLYFGAAILAYGFALIFRQTLLKGATTEVYIELPRYRLPQLRNILVNVLNRAKAFLKRAGGVIFVLSVVMWILSSYPRHPDAEATASAKLEHSLMGQTGRVLEPFFNLFGFDWKMGVSLGASFVAREVAVSTLATLYSLEGGDDETQQQSLAERLKQDPNWTLPTALSYLAFFVFAMQCLSTLAVAYRETNSIKWPVFMFSYLTSVAFIVAYLIHKLA